MVTKGQVIATIRSNELQAILDQTKSIMDAAYQKLQMAVNGARPEEKEMAEKLYAQAKHQYNLAETTYNRIIKMYNDSLISAQEKDQVEFQYKAAKEQMDQAQAKYQLVLNGARQEEILMADANLRQAENAYKEVQAYTQELTIISPISGELSKKIINVGEIAAAGYPVFTVLDVEDVWIVLQLREDMMQNFQKGNVFKGQVPALGNIEFEFTVSYISAMGDFATWKPTNQKGDFDLKTFEVRLTPKNKIEGLRRGMTVNISLNSETQNAK
jgi:Multidrug resistance efflux pump